jgi:phage terminase large subunit GpA-like protein
MTAVIPKLSDIRWLQGKVAALPTEILRLKISEWAEKKRYLSTALTDNPGPWSNKFAPYLVEIMDCFAPDNPIREVAAMKGGQIAFTTGVLENWIGFIIDQNPGPTMYLTGSEDMAKTGVEIRLDRMLDSAKLWGKIRAAGKKTRKTGNTASRKDFRGGFLLTYGGQSVKKLKQVSIKNLMIDDIDELPLFIGTQGDPIKLALVRQRSFDAKRKTLYQGTPTFVNGPIHKLFLQGDQRHYYVPCKYCGFMQILQFRGTRKDGKKFGIYYEVDKNFILVYDSVEYRCENCLKGWKNHDKYDFLNAGEWRPTQKTKRHRFRSYHLGAEYSPEGVYPWETLVEEWLECWSERTKKIVNVEALKVFQNTARGLPYEERGESPSYERVVQHRRSVYTRNEIPNLLALQETESPILVVTAAFDVHKNRIDCEIKGWCRDRRSYSIDWRHLEGDTADLDSPAWNGVRKIIEEETWVADDGKKYRAAISLIDAAYRTGTVYEFVSEYTYYVYAIMGRDMPQANANMAQFTEYNKKGITAYNVTVTIYKDRLAADLRRDWNDGELQPIGYPNFPEDYGDDFFREHEAEEKVKKKFANGRVGYVWKQKNENDPNHAWDCDVYNNAALDMLCYDVNLYDLKQDRIDYTAFWDYIETNKVFYRE